MLSYCHIVMLSWAEKAFPPTLRGRQGGCTDLATPLVSDFVTNLPPQPASPAYQPYIPTCIHYLPEPVYVRSTHDTLVVTFVATFVVTYM